MESDLPLTVWQAVNLAAHGKTLPDALQEALLPQSVAAQPAGAQAATEAWQSLLPYMPSWLLENLQELVDNHTIPGEGPLGALLSQEKKRREPFIAKAAIRSVLM